MRAAVFNEFGGDIKVVTVPDPEPGPDDVVLRVIANGICRSDWHGWVGHDLSIKLPHVPGHECAGVVESVGSAITRLKPGDRVVVPFSGGCGTCQQCSKGLHNICDNDFQPGFSDWGAFAEYVRIGFADENLVILPDTIDFSSAASLGCRFMTAFGAVIDRARLQGNETIAVFGCGGVGLSAIMIASAIGSRVIAVDVRDSALEQALAAGAETAIRSDHGNAAGEILELTNGGADVTLDAIGSPSVVAQSVRALKKRGRHVQVGLLNPSEAAAPVPIDLIVARELHFVGSHGLSTLRFNELIEWCNTGKLKPGKLVTSKISLEAATRILMDLDREPTIGVTIIDQF